ncbi:MAG: endonuclease/exonuclease/phosphatase family protein [Verrucomicrobiota bacterium]
MKLRILTWNVLTSEKKHFAGSNWDTRRSAFEKILDPARFDIICLQEATPSQLKFFISFFSDFDHFAVGRNDGQSRGEHCPIFFRKSQFQLTASENFWLTPTPKVPSCGWGELFPRICTNLVLTNTSTLNTFRIWNTHLPLHPYARLNASKLLASRIRESNATPSLLLGDFNCGPKSRAMSELIRAHLNLLTTGKSPTFHMFGNKLLRLDHIMGSNQWSPIESGEISESFAKVYPSDHFGLWADLTLKNN